VLNFIQNHFSQASNHSPCQSASPTDRQTDSQTVSQVVNQVVCLWYQHHGKAICLVKGVLKIEKKNRRCQKQV